MEGRAKLARAYEQALRACVDGSEEEAINLAYRLGHLALESGLTLLELVSLHLQAIERLCTAEPPTPATVIRNWPAQAEFLIEALGPFEMVHRGFRETNELLRETNKTLEDQVREKAAVLREREAYLREIRTLNAELDERVQQRTAELEAANRELEAFSYSVSHDLRNPLQIIYGYASLLRRRLASRQDTLGEEYLAEIYGASEVMSGMIDGLLLLSRSGRQELRLEDVNMSRLAREVAHELSQQAPNRQVRFVIGRGLHAQGDERLLRVVLENLLGNAWKFTGKRACATIRFGQVECDGEPAFFVKDNGCGFDPISAHKLFEPFQRLHPREDFPGSGIGLATVQRIIARHGGRVWAEGAPNKGATFFFTL